MAEEFKKKKSKQRKQIQYYTTKIYFDRCKSELLKNFKILVFPKGDMCNL